jgi:hypothetical protein
LFDAEIGPWNPSGPGTGAFLVPLIVNGKVYIAADHVLIVYSAHGQSGQAHVA